MGTILNHQNFIGSFYELFNPHRVFARISFDKFNPAVFFYEFRNIFVRQVKSDYLSLAESIQYMGKEKRTTTAKIPYLDHYVRPYFTDNLLVNPSIKRILKCFHPKIGRFT